MLKYVQRGNIMQKKKKNILLILTIIILAGGFITAAVLVVPKTLKIKNENNDSTDIYDGSEITGPFQPENIQKHGDHIYYSDKLWENRGLDESEKEDVIAYLSDLDKYIGNDLYICGFSFLSAYGDIFVNAYQYQNGVLIPGVRYSTEDNYPFLDLSPTSKSLPVALIDTSDIIPAQELFGRVLDLAEQNRSQMFFNPKDTTPISGIYRLEYDVKTDVLYYSFRLNEYSEIRVDARDGSIVSQYYWDGVYVD